MRSVLLVAAVLAVSSFTVLRAQKAAPVADAVNVDHLRADIQFLSCDELKGRPTTSPEAEIVAQWIASEYERYGLKPIGRSYFRPFAMTSVIPDATHSGLRVEIKQGANVTVREFGGAPADDTEVEVTGPVAFAGYGISAPEYGYDDYAGLDARGKILIIIDHEPAEFSADSPFKGTWNTRYAYRLEKQQIARQHGAIGLLILAGEARRHSSPPLPPDPDRLHRGPDWPSHRLASEDLLPVRYIPEREADQILMASGKNVADLRKEIDATVKPHSFAVDGTIATIRIASRDRTTITGRNVVGVLEGSDPKLKNEYVVLTAHYDHLGMQEGRVFHGADDNASGVAGILEVMRMYALGGARPRRSVIFVALDAEEDLMLGSLALVHAPPVPIEQIVTDLNADMIGRDEDTYRAKPEEHTNSVNIVGTLYSPDLRAAVENANRAVGLTLDYKMDRDDSENMFGRSDQFSFATRNVPEVLFMTGFHRDYHTSRDTWDKIDYPKMSKIVRLMFLTSRAVADAPERPKWVP
jgi:hypothetical protein